MAVHGALCDAAQARPRAGFLASVRSIEAHVPRLDTIETPLDVEAERIGGDGINVLYRFTVRSGARILLTGRAAVVLDASVA